MKSLMTKTEKYSTTTKWSSSHITFNQSIATEQQSTNRKLPTLTTAKGLTTLKLTPEEQTIKHQTTRFYSTTEPTTPQSSLEDLTTKEPEETKTSTRQQGIYRFIFRF